MYYRCRCGRYVKGLPRKCTKCCIDQLRELGYAWGIRAHLRRFTRGWIPEIFLWGIRRVKELGISGAIVAAMEKWEDGDDQIWYWPMRTNAWEWIYVIAWYFHVGSPRQGDWASNRAQIWAQKFTERLARG